MAEKPGVARWSAAATLTLSILGRYVKSLPVTPSVKLSDMTLNVDCRFPLQFGASDPLCFLQDGRACGHLDDGDRSGL